MREADKVLDLARLPDGVPRLSAAFCTSLAEAGRVCLDERGHGRPVDLRVAGTYRAVFVVHWEEATDQLRRTYGDPEVATEHGVYGISFLLVRRLTGLEVIERSR
jgi:hypothetical protein